MILSGINSLIPLWCQESRANSPRRHGDTEKTSAGGAINQYLTSNTVCHTVYSTHHMTISGNDDHNTDLYENLRLELRRGCLVMAVLAQLKTERYGYTLRKALADDGLAIDESTLYPLLRRLESQALLVSQWREEDKRNKRFYRLSTDAKQILNHFLAHSRTINP